MDALAKKEGIIVCQLMRRQLIDICTKITQNMLPQRCLLCGMACGSRWICVGCEEDLPRHPHAHCPVCALPTPLGETCGECLKHPQHFDATHAAFAYAFPADALLRALKYQSRLAIAEWAALHIELSGTRPDYLIPMPLHVNRLKTRGFNQAMEIARALSRRYSIPLLHEAVERVRETEPQAGLPRAERTRNMRNAFACREGFSGKHVAIVDDVMTSGASLNELARMLKKAGAMRVECLVAARTLRD
nr:ComF family protein [Novimethylophilus kurashikiensis]